MRLGVARRPTRRAEVSHDDTARRWIFWYITYIYRYILGQYVDPSAYMLVRTARSDFSALGRDSERTGIGVNGSRRAPTI